MLQSFSMSGFFSWPLGIPCYVTIFHIVKGLFILRVEKVQMLSYFSFILH